MSKFIITDGPYYELVIVGYVDSEQEALDIINQNRINKELHEKWKEQIAPYIIDYKFPRPPRPVANKLPCSQFKGWEKTDIGIKFRSERNSYNAQMVIWDSEMSRINKKENDLYAANMKEIYSKFPKPPRFYYELNYQEVKEFSHDTFGN